MREKRRMEKLVFSEFVQPGRNFYMADLILGKEEITLPHCHDFYEFQIVLEGNFLECWNEEQLDEQQRCAHFVCPNDVHCLKGLQHKNVLRNIAVCAAVMEDALGLYGMDTEVLKRPFLLSDLSDVFIREKTVKLFQITDEKKKNAVFLNILYDFLFCVLQRAETAPEIPGWLEELKKEMEKEENFLAGPNRMTELSGRSREHISRCFKRYYGMTPSAFLYRCRLQKAAVLLVAEKDSVLNIALESGFENLSYFHRLFRRQFGISPGEYREKSRRLFTPAGNEPNGHAGIFI